MAVRVDSTARNRMYTFDLRQNSIYLNPSRDSDSQGIQTVRIIGIHIIEVSLIPHDCNFSKEFTFR